MAVHPPLECRLDSEEVDEMTASEGCHKGGGRPTGLLKSEAGNGKQGQLTADRSDTLLVKKSG